MPTALGTIASGYKATTGPIPTTGLQGWWDADDASTFTYSSGAIVSQWRDKSGNNRHANASGGAAPTVVPASMNGHPTLYLTGALCWMNIAPFASAYTTAELFAVLKIKTLAGNGARSQMLAAWGINTEVGWYPFVDGTVYENWGITGRPAMGVASTATLLAPHIYNIRLAPGSITAVINGTTIGSSGATVGFGNTIPYKFGIEANVNEPPDGYIAEIVMYDRVLSTVERQQVESYLTAKWIPAGTDVLLENFTSVADWTGSITSVAGGRTGNAGRVSGSGIAAFTIPAINENATATVGFAWQVSTLAATRNIIQLASDTAATIHDTVLVNTNGSLSARLGAAGTTHGTTAAGLVVINTWYYIEVQVVLHDTTGQIKVRLNGTEVLNVANTDTKNGGTKTVFDSIRLFAGGSGSVALFDDLYITTGAGAPFKGDTTIP
jgi:hypothetical protein